MRINSKDRNEKEKKMYRFYEKVQKSEEHPYGMTLLDEEENPFKSGPCLVSMLALPNCERDMNAALNFGVEALRIKSKRNPDSHHTIEEYDGRILALAFGEPREYQYDEEKGYILDRGCSSPKLNDEFVQKYLLPLVEENGQRISKLQAKKNMRNVNFLTFCDATDTALSFQGMLAEKMILIGYSEQEIEEILSQVCIIGHLTDVVLKKRRKEEKIFGTVLSCIDVNDDEITVPGKARNTVRERDIGIVKYTGGYYCVNGSGQHSSKEAFYEANDLLLGISCATGIAMSNAMKNSRSEQFVPIDIHVIEQELDKIVDQKREGKTNQEIFEEMASTIVYNAPNIRSTDDDGR